MNRFMLANILPIAAASVLFCACASLSEGPGTRSEARGKKAVANADEDAALIEAVWAANEEVILSVLDGQGEIDQERLARAVEFFEGLTGIMSNTGTYFGRLPTPQLHDTLESWRAWYRENRDALVLDTLSCRLQVRGSE